MGIVVDDLPAAKAFFTELGLELRGEMPVGGDLVDRIVGLQGIQAEIAMMATPDGHNKIELVKFHAPPAPPGDPQAPANVPGLSHLTFAVDDLDATLSRLQAHGAELVGTVENYEDVYRLCYIRGPAGVIVELAEKIG